jgi:hypothetical protein
MGKDANDKPIIADDGGLGVRVGLDVSVDALVFITFFPLRL